MTDESNIVKDDDITTCESCGDEILVSELESCPECGLDGLCADCLSDHDCLCNECECCGNSISEDNSEDCPDCDTGPYCSNCIDDHDCAGEIEDE